MEETNLSYSVYEGSGGQLTLIVFNNDLEAIYAHSGYEYNRGQLKDDINAIKNGEHPIKNGWEGGVENPKKLCKEIYEDFYSKLIVEDDTYFYDIMGSAGQDEFFNDEIRKKINDESETDKIWDYWDKYSFANQNDAKRIRKLAFENISDENIEKLRDEYEKSKITHYYFEDYVKLCKEYNDELFELIENLYYNRSPWED